MSTKTEHCASVHVRIEPSLDEWLSKIASYKGVTKAHMARMMLEKAVVAEVHELSVLQERAKNLDLFGN